MGKKKITLVTKATVDWNELADEKVQMEVIDLVGGIGHDDIPFVLDWSDEESQPLFKKYLVEIYGDNIKKHEEFLLLSC